MNRWETINIRGRSIWWRLADLVDYALTNAPLALVDWLAPTPSKPEDEARERKRRQRLRRAFPGVDIDGSGPRWR